MNINEKLLIAIVSMVGVLIVLLSLMLFNSPSRKRYITSMFGLFSKRKYEKMEDYIEKLAISLEKLSRSKIGAIIVFENNVDLSEYVESGHKIISDFSSDVVRTIFQKKSLLHDGAIIVKNWTIISCSSFLPSTTTEMDINYGSRHRAGLGITEISDAIAFVVSEETGKISYMQKGKMKHIKKTKLRLELTEILN